MIRKKVNRRFKKNAKKVKELALDNVEKAGNLNPLAEGEPAPLTDENVPRITNETIAEHREDVLKGARKYIYPLRHSTRRIVIVTTTLVSFAIIGLLVYCSLGLYRYYQYNSFLYRVTQVVPFPVARINGTFVDYENYLFELRHYVHYYQTQQQNLFGGEQQVNTYRKQVLQTVIDEAYIKKLAAQNHIGVSSKEVNERIDIVRSQNRLGSNNKVFADVLRDYWGWSVSDFKRALKSEILAEKVTAQLDTAQQAKAQSVLAQLNSGANFSDLAKKYSDDDATKQNGGDYGFGITKNNPNVPPQVVDELFKLKKGQVSGIIVASPVQTGQPVTLEIVKVTQNDGTTVTAQHISFKLKDISTYLGPLKAKQPAHTYVKF